jgi:hypothetical protein
VESVLTDSIKIHFFTEHLDERKYTDAILEYMFSHIRKKELYPYAVEFNKWTINIFPTRLSDYDFGEVNNNGRLNSNIPHGVTNKNLKTCDIWVSDNKGVYAMLQNFVTISHELAHLVLVVFFPTTRSIYRHQDKSWGKAGATGNLSTTEVHDREHEWKKWKRYVSIFRWNLFGRNIGRIRLPCLELRDLTDNPESASASFYQ